VLPEVDPGRFEAAFVCSQSGLYTARVRAQGTTFYGSTFQREQTLSAAVYPGGGNPDGTGGPTDDGTSDHHPGQAGGSGGQSGGHQFWCEILTCLLSGKVISSSLLAELKQRGLDLAALLRCLKKHCQPATKSASASDLNRLARLIAKELG